MYCVIGSGPAGVACAHALLEKGLTVRMLDGGLTLEPARQEAVNQLSQSAPANWDPKLVAMMKDGMTSSAKGIPLKRVYGSDFPYRETDTCIPGSYDGVGSKPSLARGGLSNVWGSTVMPYVDYDLGDWPIREAQLAEHYAAVLKFLPVSARNDDLAKIFPLHIENPPMLDLSRQARALLGDLERHKAALNGQGIHYGAARVAIRAKRTPQDSGCVYCGMCMYGCPYGYIYNSASTLQELQKNPNFTYQPDTVVQTLNETAQGVTINARDRKSGASITVEAERVFLGAGVIATARILLESRQLYDQTVWLKDSQYYLVPLLRAQRMPDVRGESLHTLSQLFLEIFDRKLSSRSIHLQVYSYNDLVSGALRETFGKFGVKSDWLVRQLEERLMIVQGYLHSDHSSRIAVTLKRPVGNALPQLELKAEINPKTKPAIKRVVSTLMRNARNLGGVPLLPMLQIAEPGRGFHTGGSFPMRSNPGPFESDILGRPHGWSRVHAIDATVFPTIPATTITFSVMANAHRIGSQAARLVGSSSINIMQKPAQQKTCLVTGSRGYLGSCVRAAFEQAGWKIVELTRNPAPEEVRSGRAIQFTLGGNISPETLRGADALVHCAYDFTGRSWEKIHETNVVGSTKLLTAAREAGVKSLIFISTMSAFNGCKSLYGQAKLEIERNAPPGTLVMRPGLIYGDSPRGMFGNLVGQVKKSNRVPIFGEGSQVLYLSHNVDLCQAMLDFANGQSTPVTEPVIAAHDRGWTFKQILQEIARAQGKQIQFLKLPWRLVWLGIKSFELCHVPLDFRSDSLVSLMNQDLHPSFAATQKGGFKFRLFDAGKLKL